ncbi:3-hydroxyisobutyryl-CoA hydrolase 1-like [Rosa rugosa]|uniref:3-hydroxyisobutyryl-CoA hydrolase 1-like n=1 Tax=Rosa rugosa TaxID=74645 RepID=UPI002B403B97|nr:3-hydroxyisobutyryl-CoA hydrolase 1-like [Rosa rugosa]
MVSFNLDHHRNPEVLIQDFNSSAVRILTLNRPRHFNALSGKMLSQLLRLFLAHDHDVKVKVVILKGNGEVFSVGGDIVEIARHLYSGDLRHGLKTTEEAYKLLYLIATYSKPQVSILNGIAMGRGAAIYLPSRFRIATENSLFSMPETALGAVPETGASYFLSRLPGFLGEYLALTGARLDGPEMLACGLATHFVPATKLALLEQELIASIGALTNERTSSCDLVFYVSSIIHKYSIQPALKERDSAWHNMDVIEKCFSKRTVEEVVSALEKEATYTDGHVNGANPWLTSTIQSLKKASPISLKISLRSIREGRSQGLGECLVREYRMVYHIATGEISTDFREGCTALLVDKDKIQKWEPCKLELVSDQMVDRYFSKLDEVE